MRAHRNTWEELRDALELVFPFHLAIHARGIVGFIPQVPTQHAIVVAELAQHTRDVVVQRAGIAAVIEAFSTRTLHPPGVVHPSPWRPLPTRSGERVPAGVEQDKERFDVVSRRDGDELREPGLETGRVLGPQQVVEEDSHGVEPVKPRKAQLVVDAPGIVCAWLEHLELVDGVRGDVVCTDEPAVRLIPAMCAVGRPPAWFSGGGPRRLAQHRACRQQQRELQGRSTVHKMTIVSRPRCTALFGDVVRLALSIRNNLRLGIVMRTPAWL